MNYLHAALCLTVLSFALGADCIAKYTDSNTTITTRDIDRMANDMVSKLEYDYDKYPFLKDDGKKDSLKEAISLAIREKIRREANTEGLEDIIDDIIGRPETENYLVARMLFRYMVNENLNLDNAIERLREVLSDRLSDVETFAKIANAEAIIKRSSSDIVNDLKKLNNSSSNMEGDKNEEKKLEEQSKLNEKPENTNDNDEIPTGSAAKVEEGDKKTSELSETKAENADSVFPSRSDTSTEPSTESAGEPKLNEYVKPAQDIFEIIETITPSTTEPEEAINKTLGDIPSTDETAVNSVQENTLELILKEKEAGNNPIAINWCGAQKNDSHLQKFIPKISESLAKLSESAKKNSCWYSEELYITNLKNSDGTISPKEAPQKVELISCNTIEDSSTDQTIRELVRMQGVMALLTEHDVLIVGMNGFNVSKDRLAQIGKIYNEELSNPLVKGKLKKVFFAKGDIGL